MEKLCGLVAALWLASAAGPALAITPVLSAWAQQIEDIGKTLPQVQEDGSVLEEITSEGRSVAYRFAVPEEAQAGFAAGLVALAQKSLPEACRLWGAFLTKGDLVSIRYSYDIAGRIEQFSVAAADCEKLTK